MLFVYYDGTALACECFHDFVAHAVAYMIGVFFHSGVFRLFLFFKVDCRRLHTLPFFVVVVFVVFLVCFIGCYVCDLLDVCVCVCFAFTLCCTSFAHAAFSCFC